MISQCINFCKNHQCSRCGECCASTIPMTKKEVYKIRDYLNMHPDIRKKVYENKPIKNGNVYLKCCFLLDDSCLIYPVRPLICKQFKCDQCEKTISLNRDNAHKRADYNRVDDLSTITDLRELLFDDSTTVIYSVAHAIGTRDATEIKNFLSKIGRNDLATKIKGSE